MEKEPRPEEVEHIQAAALLFGDQMYTGRTHLDALAALNKEHPDFQFGDGRTPKQGFITSAGRFVDRDEAEKIAGNAEQLKHSDSKSRKGTKRELLSEDLSL